MADMLSKEKIESRMRTETLGKSVVYYEETDSTNVRVRELAQQGAEHGTLVVADRQSAGKGRRGRGWDSPAGKNIYMTLLLRPQIETFTAPMLTLVMALSAAEAIEEKEGLPAKIKWPNDLVIGTKKICGILTEMSADENGIHYVMIGVGINTNVETFSEELKDRATSLSLEKGETADRAGLIAGIVKKFEENYERFLEVKDLSFMQEKYNQMLVNRDREVRVLEPGNEYNAYALGINRTGELLVKRENGQEEVVFAGEVSVRGIYGYV